MSNNNYGNSNNGSGNNDYWISKSFIKSIRSLFNKVGSFAFGFVFAVSLLAGVVYAWNAVWHGTDWIQPGAVIDGQKVAENMEFLKREVDQLRSEINNINNAINSQLTNIEGTIVAGCYSIPPSVSGDFIYVYNYIGGTCWGGAQLSAPNSMTNTDIFVICPPNTKKVTTGITYNTPYFEGGDGGVNGGVGWSRTYFYESAVCITQTQ